MVSGMDIYISHGTSIDDVLRMVRRCGCSVEGFAKNDLFENVTAIEVSGPPDALLRANNAIADYSFGNNYLW
jgi:hypothetical protein